MSNQQLLDDIESNLPAMPIDLKEKILDAVWQVITDNREEPEEDPE